MKRNLHVIAVVCCIFSLISCNKEAASTEELLLGPWKQYKSEVVKDGEVVNTRETDNVRLWFYNDGSFMLWENGVTVGTKFTYSLQGDYIDTSRGILYEIENISKSELVLSYHVVEKTRYRDYFKKN